MRVLSYVLEGFNRHFPSYFFYNMLEVSSSIGVLGSVYYLFTGSYDFVAVALLSSFMSLWFSLGILLLSVWMRWG